MNFNTPVSVLVSVPVTMVVPIPGTRKIDHLHEKLGALAVELSPADQSQIDTAFSKVRVYGGRMNETHMKVLDK